jgi:hypothetical protein
VIFSWVCLATCVLDVCVCVCVCVCVLYFVGFFSWYVCVAVSDLLNAAFLCAPLCRQLSDNQISSLPAGVFDGPTILRNL